MNDYSAHAVIDMKMAHKDAAIENVIKVMWRALLRQADADPRVFDELVVHMAVTGRVNPNL